MILVVGSTGVLGSEICRRLALAGRPVRGLVREGSDPAKVDRLKGYGAQLVKGDLCDQDSLKAACQGVSAVICTVSSMPFSYLPGVNDIQSVDCDGVTHLIEAAKAAGVRRFVYVSIPLGMEDCPLTLAKRTVEKVLSACEMEYTILCPCIFMEVWLTPALGFDYLNAKTTIYGDGHAKNGYISVGDVAQYAVESLDNPNARNAVFELGHPQAYSLLEVVRIFEKVSEKSFDLQFVPVSALEAQRSAATDPLQVSFATLMHNMALGIKVDTRAAEKAFSFPLVSVESYAQRILG